jgi:hypothetical protein
MSVVTTASKYMFFAECEEVLKQYRREYEFLESQRNFGGRFNAFESDGTKEIVEKYNEEEDKKWRGTVNFI